MNKKPKDRLQQILRSKSLQGNIKKLVLASRAELEDPNTTLGRVEYILYLMRALDDFCPSARTTAAAEKAQKKYCALYQASCS